MRARPPDDHASQVLLAAERKELLWARALSHAHAGRGMKHTCTWVPVALTQPWSTRENKEKGERKPMAG